MNEAHRLRVPVTNEDHSLEPMDAPLTLVEYGDYECPFCREAHGVMLRLREKLKDDLRYVFRNFPLSTSHPHAMDAARFAEAAGLQGKFWEMHHMLFENQENLEPTDLVRYAQDLGLDLEQLAQDMKSPAIDEKIAQDLYGGARSGVSGTPSFFINGFKYEGDYSFGSMLTELTGLKKAG